MLLPFHLLSISPSVMVCYGNMVIFLGEVIITMTEPSTAMWDNMVALVLFLTLQLITY